MRRVVVLPAPFGPEQAEHAAAGDREGQALHGDVAGEGLAHAVEADGEVGQEGLLARGRAGSLDYTKRVRPVFGLLAGRSRRKVRFPPDEDLAGPQPRQRRRVHVLRARQGQRRRPAVSRSSTSSQDIESLNRAAEDGRHEVTAISFHAYPYVADRYALMPCGGSIGDGYGPLLVAREALDPAARCAGAASRCPATLHDGLPRAEALRARGGDLRRPLRHRSSTRSSRAGPTSASSSTRGSSPSRGAGPAQGRGPRRLVEGRDRACRCRSAATPCAATWARS